LYKRRILRNQCKPVYDALDVEMFQSQNYFRQVKTEEETQKLAFY